MRFRSIAILAAACPTAAPALALETFDCADAKGEVTLQFDYEHGDAPFKRVQMQIIDDIGISTDPAHPDFDGEYIASQSAGRDFHGVDVHWKDASEHEHRALSLRLVLGSEGQTSLVGGVLAVDAGGVWAVTCVLRDGRLPAEVW